jgi:hypothetical protein
VLSYICETVLACRLFDNLIISPSNMIIYFSLSVLCMCIDYSMLGQSLIQNTTFSDFLSTVAFLFTLYIHSHLEII